MKSTTTSTTTTMVLIALLAMTVLMAGKEVRADCAAFPSGLESNVCRFGDQDTTIVLNDANCVEVNERPFALMSQQCYDLMIADGEDCSYAIASYYCSRRCPECGTTTKLPCESICNAASTKCPGMWANSNCQVANQCVADAQCTNTPVNKGAVDDVTGLSSSDDDSAPGKPSMGLWIVALGSIAVYLATAHHNRHT